MQENVVELGIIIKTARTGEADLRLGIFTVHGIRYITAKGVCKPKARFASSVGLFTVAEFTTAGHALAGINVLVSPYEIAKEINRYYLACAVADSLLHLEFVEQTPAVLVAAVNTFTELAETNRSCYPIFIEYFSELLDKLGYGVKLDYNKSNPLNLTAAKKYVQKILNAFALNADYYIPFAECFIK